MLEFLTYLYTRFLPHPDEDRGATMVEYALIVSLIAIAAIVAVTAFGTELSNFFSGLGPFDSGG